MRGSNLERFIYSLIPELKEIRDEFIKMLLVLDNIEAYRETFISAGARAEKLVIWFEETSGIKSESPHLFDKIERLQKEGVIPSEITAYLHTIRIFANKARHGGEKIIFSRRDIENILNILLRVIEWAYCEYEKGPHYPSIYRELPNVNKLATNTILPGLGIYLLLNPLGGVIFNWLKIQSETIFLGFILFIMIFTFLDQFIRTKKFLGIRTESDAEQRFRSYGALLFASILVILSSPLLVTSYTGIDPYGIFLFLPKNSRLWSIVIDLIFNFILASIATLLFFWIALEWTKRKPQDIVAFTFTSLCIPIGIVYLISVLVLSRGTESYLLVAFFPLLAGLLATIGYSHPYNKVDIFTARLLIILCIIFMTLGFVLALGGLLFKLYEFGHLKFQNIFETMFWRRAFNWESLGLSPDEYVEKLKMGFTWMVLTASIYLELVIGFTTTLTIYHYQYIPALKSQKNIYFRS